MKYLELILVTSFVAVGVTGCSRSEPKSESWRKYAAPQGGYTFKYPSTWSVEAIPDANGLLVMCPTVEADWQANVFFELRSDPETRSVIKTLEDLTLNLKKEKAGFALTSSGVTKHPSGLKSGRIDYTHNSDGTGLTDAETIIVLSDKKLLVVLSSTASAVSQKYQSTFQRIVDSITTR